MYSQRDEEPVILKALAHISAGRALDCGAFDGRTFSVTLALIELGWSGVMVEPSPGPFKALQALHKDRPNIECIQAAAVLRPEPAGVTLWANDDALSTTEISHRDKWASYAPFTEIKVPAITVAEIAAKGPFDFVNVDTEATSVAILEGLMSQGLKPTLICVENDGLHERLRRDFDKWGYKVIHTTVENTLALRI